MKQSANIILFITKDKYQYRLYGNGTWDKLPSPIEEKEEECVLENQFGSKFKVRKHDKPKEIEHIKFTEKMPKDDLVRENLIILRDKVNEIIDALNRMEK